ncbi:DUF5994 family protein [Streptomyces sp. URMC 126]|uniref:DUF5994 family protein n=1 Tax=Streptomyces sp. URMC 126 TaxID=3423401 RepID=UPI003F1BE6F2
MTVTTGRTPVDTGVPPLRARLSLTPGSVPGLLDGAWWPRSRDLGRELPPLIERLDRCWGRITRVTVNPAFWPVIPRKVPVIGHTLRIGRFDAEQDRHKLLLLSPAGRWDLLIIPPETGPAAAGRLMAAASVPGSLLTASELLEDERLAGEQGRPEADRTGEDEGVWEGEGAWETDGGAQPALAGPVAAPATTERTAAVHGPVEPAPPPGRADVRIVAASPDTARRVAEVLRRCFDSTEQRSYPAGREGGTRLHLAVDTTRPAEPARSWLETSRDATADQGRQRRDT